ncbi:uncharacterized protein LOC114270844 [Camellia sinensis]|uniref:uncharacterized protein LOC114270844 n=1 Tax=Camellia sinensis TaxID=4442 RepID=UPI001035A950|nr:uncharacterized protein LOC114270844 [Camellia sinensis]
MHFVRVSEMNPSETVVQLPPVMAVPPPESALHVPPPPLPEAVVQVPHPLDAAAEPSESLAQAPPPLDAPPEPVIPRNAQQQDLELPKLVVAFCFTAAFEIAFRSVQARRLLEHAGLLCGVTAFFVAITVSFPLCLKLISSWVVYALSLLAISICNSPPPL